MNRVLVQHKYIVALSIVSLDSVVWVISSDCEYSKGPEDVIIKGISGFTSPQGFGINLRFPGWNIIWSICEWICQTPGYYSIKKNMKY